LDASSILKGQFKEVGSMALVKSFVRLPDGTGSPHPTTVECAWKSFDAGDQRILQLDTYGSDDRQIPGKISQTLQFDRDRAAELLRVIRTVFPDLS
jgi:hypothetical protein